MNDLNLTISIISFLVLALGLVKNIIKKSILSEPLISLIIGVLLGPLVFGFIDPFSWERPDEILHESTRYTLALAIMASALRLPADYLKKNVRPYLVVLIGGMVLMLTFASLFYLAFGMEVWESILLGAILTPTDPVLATTIVSSSYANENIPGRLRNMITAEAASNDGLAYLFVLLPIYIMESGRHTLGNWFTDVFLWEIIGAIILGALVGYAAGKAFRFFRSRGAMEPKTLLAFTLALTFFVETTFSSINMNGLIGIFASGIVFQTLVGEETEVRHEKVQSMMERIFIVPVFVLLGTMIPWSEWLEMPLYFWLITPLVIFLRRIPAWLALKPVIRVFSWKDGFFAGWFGPIGVAALFYITMLMIDYPEHEKLWPVVSYAVVLSTLLHAVSANPLSRLLYKAGKPNKRNDES